MVVDKDTPPQFGRSGERLSPRRPRPLAHFVAVDMALDPAFQNIGNALLVVGQVEMARQYRPSCT